ncbi:hypothetical protein BK025_06455 [Sodalis sp. TME1]|nr:hypothetical protein BK025_06455 [Sodalis sp. TME1]
MKELTLFNTPARINSDGMICLTDIWQIAKNRVDSCDAKFLGGREIESIRPSKFIKNAEVKLFINELSKWDSGSHLKSVRGNGGGTTYGSRFLAYKYAAYIDPAFEVGVYKVVDKYFSGEMVTIASYMAEANLVDHQIKEEASVVSDCARTMNYWGVGGRKQQLLAKRQEAYARLQITLPKRGIRYMNAFLNQFGMMLMDVGVPDGNGRYRLPNNNESKVHSWR